MLRRHARSRNLSRGYALRQLGWREAQRERVAALSLPNARHTRTSHEQLSRFHFRLVFTRRLKRSRIWQPGG
jgi:hypothetical protein